MGATTTILDIRNQLAAAAIARLATFPKLTDLNEKTYYLELITETNLALLLWKTDDAYAPYRVTGPKGNVAFNWPAWAYDNNFLLMPGIDFENQAAAVAAFKELHSFEDWRNGAIAKLPGYPRINLQYLKNFDIVVDGKTMTSTFANTILYFAIAYFSLISGAGGDNLQFHDVTTDDANWNTFDVTNSSITELGGNGFVLGMAGGSFTNSVVAHSHNMSGGSTWYEKSSLYDLTFTGKQLFNPSFVNCDIENVIMDGAQIYQLSFQGEKAPKNLSCRGISFDGMPTYLSVIKFVGKDGLKANLSGVDFSKSILSIFPTDIPLFILTGADFTDVNLYNPMQFGVPMQGPQIADYLLANGMSKEMVDSIKGIGQAPQLAVQTLESLAVTVNDGSEASVLSLLFRPSTDGDDSEHQSYFPTNTLN